MILQSKYIEDENGVKYAPITTPNAVRWPDGSNLNDKLGSISYNDLENKPTIPDAQIQSDWNQSDNTQKDFIKNKPTIPAAQVQSDWNASTGMGVILNKPTIPTVPTNVSAFTNDAGYLTSHQNISGKEDNSNKVTSLSSQSTDTQYPSAKCVYDALNAGLKVATVSSDAAISIAADNITVISGDVGTATITLTVPSDNNAHVWNFFMTTDSTVAVTLTMSDSGTIIYPKDYLLEADTLYEINMTGINGTYYLRYGEFVTT